MKLIPPERWRRIQGLFDEAVEMEPAERAAFLDKVGAEDPALRQQVESLVLSSEEHGAFLTDAIARAGGASTDPAVTLVGRDIGAYRVLEEAGVGGMGAVYLAERADEEFRKRVAIKVVQGGLVSPELLRRFRSERQILAALEHPNIARLLDGGTTDDGLSYVVMEYVEGKSIDRFCDDEGLSVPKRLALFRIVCAAVQHAHQNLVVHRDIKPGNILVAADGSPKLLDFGIAKLLESNPDPAETTPTQPVTRLLTPEYASPEQVRGGSISTASDVYSLGVVLYELLTGRRPYELATTDLLELQRRIVDEEPVVPSRAVLSGGDTWRVETISRSRGTDPKFLCRMLAGDLDNIVMKALSKEPSRRYGSATELSEDLRRHLEGRPVSAQKDTWRYRAGKFARRHRVAVSAAAAFTLLLAGFGVTMALQAARIAEERDIAGMERERADTQRRRSEQVSGFLQEMLASIDPAVARGRDVTLLRDLLNEAAEKVEGELAGQPEVAATLHATIGNTYTSIALYEEAEPHLRRALRLRREVLGGDHTDVADSSYELAVLLFETGAYEEAEVLLRDALAMRRELQDPDGLEVSAILSKLAVVLEARESYDEAEAAFRETLEMRRRILGNDHPDVALSMRDLGGYLMSPRAERLDEAEQVLRESLAIFRKNAGEHPLGLSDAAHNLAGLLRRRQEFAAAEPLYREALEIKRRILGNAHPGTAVTLNNLASMFESARDFESAEPLYREALAIERAAHGDSHREVGTTVNNLAGLLRKAGRYDEANVLYHEAIDIYRESLGAEHMWVGIVLCNYADNLERSGNCTAADEVLDECIELRRKSWPEDHWRIAMAQTIRANCMKRRRQWEESESLLLESLAVMREQRGASDVRFVMLRLVELYDAWSNPEKAAEYRELLRALEGLPTP